MQLYEPTEQEYRLGQKVLRAYHFFQDQYAEKPTTVEINSLTAPEGVTHIYGLPLRVVEWTPPGHIIVTDGKRIVILAID